MTVTFDGADYVTTYHYLDANRPGKTDLRVGKVERTYDSLQRETEHRVYSNDHLNKYLETTTTFIPVSGNRTTQLPKIYTTFREEDGTQTRPGGYTGFTYAYDANGNITSVTETNGTSSRVRSYTYDAMNRLTQDVDPVTGKTTTYTYDTRGNILTKTAAGQTVTYTYGDSTWKDLLTSYNGQTITYDTIGNPLSYRGMTFAWQQGRQLASATLANGTAITYRYNTDGIRIGKTVGNVTTEYVVDDSGTVHAMKQGEHTLIFMYDATGRREGFICYSSTYGNAAYYYLYNAQGDVIGLTDGDLNTVVQYAYDAWGNPTALTGTKASTIGTLNPFRYRGYVYDTETELYYLQSRYYDAEVGRFINADGYVSTGQGIVGSNMFAYCGNSPVRNRDITGTRYIDALSVANEDSKQRTEMCQLQKDYALKEGNTAALMALYGVDSPSKIPAMPDGAMLFLENITSVSITGPLAIVRGQTVVMDQYKYCVYNFTGVGLSYGAVPFPADYTITAGYVYGLNTVTDYCGAFMGSSTNLIADISGGAFAFNGVRAEITGGQNYVPSIGLSLTNYTTDQTNWIYGPANIYFIPNLYPTSPGNTQVSI